MTTLAYLSEGKLYLKEGEAPARAVESRFAQEAMQRAQETHQRRAWKSQGRGAQFQSGALLWGRDSFDPSAMRIHFTGVTRGPSAGELTYVLDTDIVGGLFVYDWNSGQERRIVHKEYLRMRDLNRHPDLALTVYSQHVENGAAHLVLSDDDHVNVRDITEGDSADEAPSWVPGAGRRVVYQSSGVARNAAGHFVGYGPASVCVLDLDRGEMETVLEDPKHDLLSPRVDAAEDLYFIRRPYERPGVRYTPGQAFLDVLALPYRLGRTVLHYLNFMSLVYSRKPLTTAGGPKAEGEDLKTLILRGRVIDAEKVVRESRGDNAPSLVPKTWELVRHSRDGSERVVARGVLSFDLDASGVYYTNGTAIFHVQEGRAPRLLEKSRLIESVTVVATDGA